MQDAIINDGYSVSRGLLSPDAARELRSVVDGIYTDMSSHPPSGDLAKNLVGWNGVWIGGLHRYLSQIDAALLWRYTSIELEVISKVKEQLGREWFLLRERSYFRKSNGESRVPWHIDADAAAITAIVSDCINAWVPLDDVGVDRPTVQVIPGSHKIMRELPLATGEDRWRNEAFMSQFSEPVSPNLSPGDCLFFSWHTLHRTQPIKMNSLDVRTSCEFRFARRPKAYSYAKIFVGRQIAAVKSAVGIYSFPNRNGPF